MANPPISSLSTLWFKHEWKSLLLQTLQTSHLCLKIYPKRHTMVQTWPKQRSVACSRPSKHMGPVYPSQLYVTCDPPYGYSWFIITDPNCSTAVRGNFASDGPDRTLQIIGPSAWIKLFDRSNLVKARCVLKKKPSKSFVLHQIRTVAVINVFEISWTSRDVMEIDSVSLNFLLRWFCYPILQRVIELFVVTLETNGISKLG